MFILGIETATENASMGLIDGNGRAWEVNDDPDKVQFELVIVPEKGAPQRFQIGAHAPVLSPEDVDLTHQLWLDIVEKSPEVEFHHKDVVSLALRNLSEELRGPRKNEILHALRESAPRAKGRRGAVPKR